MKSGNQSFPFVHGGCGIGRFRASAGPLILAFALFAVAFAISPAARAIDLAEMQRLAIQNREVIEQYTARLEASGQDVVRARSEFYPAADLGFTSNRLEEKTVFENAENSVAEGLVSWNVFAGFRDKYNLKSAKFNREVELYQLQGIEQDVQLNVALAYLEVYERRANLEVAESAFQTLDKVYRDAESRYRVGLIGKNELLKFRVDYDDAAITAKEARAGLRKSVNWLSRRVGSDIRLEDLRFDEFDQLPALVDRDRYLALMLAQRSEILSLEMAIDAAAAQAQAAESGYYPRVDLVGSYRKYFNYALSDFAGADDHELRGQMVMSMNLFRGHATEASVAKARLQARELQYQLAELKNTFRTDLNNLYIDFQVSLENVEVATRSIEQAKENLRITQLKYDEGLQRESDLLDAITNLSRARYNLVAQMRTAFANMFRLTRMIDGFSIKRSQ